MPSLVDPLNWQHIDTGRGQSGGRAVFCLYRLNNNVGARCCWVGTPYRSCKVRIRASQVVTMEATRDIHENKPLSGRSSSMAAKRGHFRRRLTYEGLMCSTNNCSTTFAFVTFLRCRRINRVPTTTLRRLLPVLLRRRLRWFNHDQCESSWYKYK